MGTNARNLPKRKPLDSPKTSFTDLPESTRAPSRKHKKSKTEIRTGFHADWQDRIEDEDYLENSSEVPSEGFSKSFLFQC